MQAAVVRKENMRKIEIAVPVSGIVKPPAEVGKIFDEMAAFADNIRRWRQVEVIRQPSFESLTVFDLLGDYEAFFFEYQTLSPAGGDNFWCVYAELGKFPGNFRFKPPAGSLAAAVQPVFNLGDFRRIVVPFEKYRHRRIFDIEHYPAAVFVEIFFGEVETAFESEYSLD